MHSSRCEKPDQTHSRERIRERKEGVGARISAIASERDSRIFGDGTGVVFWCAGLLGRGGVMDGATVGIMNEEGIARWGCCLSGVSAWGSQSTRRASRLINMHER
jgi:hypothetical protein